ncbi:MAG: 1-deoxy-D-xylulose-5-phosphate synthase N-terminal domain-containing protein [Patescibacteria group bacterium]
MKQKILDISKKHKLSHIGSCITAVDIIDLIYELKKPGEKFVLSSGHAHLAHLVVMEKHKSIIDTEKALKHGIHCDRRAGCDCSTGSLGQGVCVALGMALANRSKSVWVLTSDGEMEEGSCWEALKIKADLKVDNLKWFINANGFGAYKTININLLEKRVRAFCKDVRVVRTNYKEYPFLEGISAHYLIL